MIILDHSGRVLKRLSRGLGITTNNQAEYNALIAGLEAAIELGADHVEIRMDSELVVRQIQGVYRVKNLRLAPLFRQAKELLANVGSFGIAYVPRRENCLADRLANQALDGESH